MSMSRQGSREMLGHAGSSIIQHFAPLLIPCNSFWVKTITQEWFSHGVWIKAGVGSLSLFQVEDEQPAEDATAGVKRLWPIAHFSSEDLSSCRECALLSMVAELGGVVIGKKGSLGLL